MKLALAMLLVLSACAATVPPAPAQRVIDTACKWVPSLTFSDADTPATKREIIAYATARQKNCPK